MKAQRDNRTRAESVGTFEFPSEGNHGPGNSDCMDVEGAKERSDSKIGYTKVSKSRLYQRKNGTIGAQRSVTMLA